MLGRPDAHYPVAAAAALSAGGPVLYSAGRAAESAYQPFTTPKGCTSCCRWGLSPHRKRLSCWALTAAVSSMPTPPIRLKPDRADQSRADAGDLPDPGGAVLRLRRGGKRSASGTRHPRAMTLIYPLRRRGDVGGDPRQSASADAGADSSLNMEGKESRFGILASSLFAVITTAASCGRGQCHA